MLDHWEVGYADALRARIIRRYFRRPSIKPSRFSIFAPIADRGAGTMKIADVRKNAFAMPLTSPAYPPGPYRFYNREYMIITYRTDPEKLRAVVPEPLEVDEPIVKYEFIRMPDSTGFGDYTETGRSSRSALRAEKAATLTACFSMTIHPSRVVGSSGVSPKSWRIRRSQYT